MWKGANILYIWQIYFELTPTEEKHISTQYGEFCLHVNKLTTLATWQSSDLLELWICWLKTRCWRRRFVWHRKIWGHQSLHRHVWGAGNGWNFQFWVNYPFKPYFKWKGKELLGKFFGAVTSEVWILNSKMRILSWQRSNKLKDQDRRLHYCRLIFYPVAADSNTLHGGLSGSDVTTCLQADVAQRWLVLLI